MDERKDICSLRKIVIRKITPSFRVCFYKMQYKVFHMIICACVEILKKCRPTKVSPLWNNSVVFSWNHLKITHTRTAKTEILVKIISFSMSNAHTHTSFQPIQRPVHWHNEFHVYPNVVKSLSTQNKKKPIRASQQSKCTA